MHSRHHLAVAGTFVAVGLLPITGCGEDTSSSIETSGTQQLSPSTAMPSVPVPDSMPAGDGPIEPGTYRIPNSAWSLADFTVRFPQDWTVQYGHVYARNQDEDDEFGFYAVVVDEIFADGCAGSDSGVTEFGPSVDDLVSALLEQPGPMKSGPVETTLGGYPATRLDLTVPEDFDLGPCNVADIGLQLWYSVPADKHFVLLDDGTASVYILDLNGERQVFVTQHGSATSVEDLAELQEVLDSISIES